MSSPTARIVLADTAGATHSGIGAGQLLALICAAGIALRRRRRKRCDLNADLEEVCEDDATMEVDASACSSECSDYPAAAAARWKNAGSRNQLISQNAGARSTDSLAAKMQEVELAGTGPWTAPVGVLTHHEPGLFAPAASAPATPGGAGLLPFGSLEELEQQLEASGGLDLLRPHRSPRSRCSPLRCQPLPLHLRPHCSPVGLRAPIAIRA